MDAWVRHPCWLGWQECKVLEEEQTQGAEM